MTDNPLGTGKISGPSRRSRPWLRKRLIFLAQTLGQGDVAAALPERADALGLTVVHQQKVARRESQRNAIPVPTRE